ncbi:MAG TPA: PhoH family protein [Phycisphaerae bacterium]|nr:PhoH family protein [Phycisphaerae bacterium]
MRKNYILDANILIHDPKSIFSFTDNTVIIPISVISEIDRFKKEMTDRGFNARAVVRLLDALRTGRSLAQGVSLENGGTLRVHCEADRLMSASRTDGDIDVLRVAQELRRQEPDVPVIIVTKDINLRIRADAAGLRAEDYESDRVMLADVYSGQRTYAVSEEQIESFRHDGQMPVPGSNSVSPNEYILLTSDNSTRRSALARADVDAGRLIALRESKTGLWGIKPRNKEQYFAIDALLDERIELVTLMGKAGTGKTLLAIAAAMHLVMRQKRYRGALVARPIFPLGRDIGYLPGDVGQKLDPWMKPIVDNIEFILDTGGPIKDHANAAGVINSGLIEIPPLTYIRGRSISNRFVVIDEAQNLTPLEVKTVMTRISQAAKIVFTGDPYQIDNPYVDGNSNGFTYLVNRFRGQPSAAHIELHKGERSPLAELAANLL